MVNGCFLDTTGQLCIGIYGDHDRMHKTCVSSCQKKSWHGVRTTKSHSYLRSYWHLVAMGKNSVFFKDVTLVKHIPGEALYSGVYEQYKLDL